MDEQHDQPDGGTAPAYTNGWWRYEKFVLAAIEKNANEALRAHTRLDDLIRFLLGISFGAVVTMGVWILTIR